MIERAVVQFSFISIQLEKCGKNEPAIESLKMVKQIQISIPFLFFKSFRLLMIYVEYLKSV